MKILLFNSRHEYNDIIKDLKTKMGIAGQAEPWHSFHGIRCLAVSNKIYEKHKDHFHSYNPHVEDNATIKLHAKGEKKDTIPWGVGYLGGERLWTKGMGTGVKVAVIDTGISRSHPDLKSRVRGSIHFVKGKMNGHGTHVAGTIAAAMNHYGIVGVAPEADLYDVRAFSSDGTASLTNIMKALDWSIENNMNVINMSFGMPEYSKPLDMMVRSAHTKGIVMVASAGNNGGAVEYPARYANVIGVGAINQNGKLADFSSRGIGMNRTAPGVGIYSTWLGNSYRTLDGTSMAAPHVSGLTALQLAAKRGNAQL